MQRSRPNSQLTYISHRFGRSTLFPGNLLEQVVPERPRTASLSHKPVLARQGRRPRRSQPEHTVPSPWPQHSTPWPPHTTPSPWPPRTVPPPWPQPPGPAAAPAHRFRHRHSRRRTPAQTAPGPPVPPPVPALPGCAASDRTGADRAPPGQTRAQEIHAESNGRLCTYLCLLKLKLVGS